ncbi:hypothetical protein [Enterococcus sp. AZ172]|uniref:hypothetical protein n=1 Tax=unclassified Enterococcus TaxID=2608891 RepID=UPI003F22C0D9
MKKFFRLPKKKKEQQLRTKENTSRTVNLVLQRTNDMESKNFLTSDEYIEQLKKELDTVDRRMINLMLPSNHSITVNGKVLILPIDRKKMVQLEQKKQQLMTKLVEIQQRQSLATVIKQAMIKSNQAQIIKTSHSQKNVITNKVRCI